MMGTMFLHVYRSDRVTVDAEGGSADFGEGAHMVHVFFEDAAHMREFAQSLLGAPEEADGVDIDVVGAAVEDGES